MEIVTGYWWATSIEESVKCIDRISSENIMFDFILIDRKLTGKEQSEAESSNSNDDPNKAYLTKQFPWYNQKSYTYTGDFLFLYLTLINKAYLRNIYFVSAQEFNDNDEIQEGKNSDGGIIKIWYNVAEIEFESSHDKFMEWFRMHYIPKSTDPSNAYNQLINNMSLPHAGICNQFHEALDIFKYLDVLKKTPVLDLRFREILINLLLSSKQYDNSLIDKKDLAELRDGLYTLTQFIADNILKSKLSGKALQPKWDEVYLPKWDKVNNQYKTELKRIYDGNKNINPYYVAQKLNQLYYIKNSERLGYLISIVYHIQSEALHNGANIDISKVLDNKYTMHTVVFAFLELCRYVVKDILQQNSNRYQMQ